MTDEAAIKNPGTQPLGDILQAARDADASGRHDTAQELWAQIRHRFPERPIGYVGAVRSARKSGQRKIARALAVEGLQHFPKAPALIRFSGDRGAGRRSGVQATGDRATRRTAFAAEQGAKDRKPAEALRRALRGTRRRKPKPEALTRALGEVEALQSKFPTRPDIRLALLHLLRSLGRLDEARARGEIWAAENPPAIAVCLELAEVLDNAGDLPAIRTLLASVLERAGTHPRVEAKLISIMSRQEDPETEAYCAQALARHPGADSVLRIYATLPQSRGDWPEALRRWNIVNETSPGSRILELGRRACQLQMAVGDPADDTEAAAFFGRFESLGGTLGGCEFGMVQRQHGSTALGLLRFGNIRPEDLITGLQSGFAGVGLVENTELRVRRVSAEKEEYMVFDKNCHLASHTQISPQDVPHEKMLIQTARRLAYLRDGLLDQLNKNTKIFVYKFLKLPDDPEQVMRGIWLNIRRYGPVNLICAVLSKDPALRGTFRKLEDGLYIGYISRFLGESGIAGADFDVLAWKSVCTSVLADIEGRSQ